MAPKKGAKNPNSFLGLECLRDPKEDSCITSTVNSLKKCASKSTSDIWPDFKDDSSNAGLDQMKDADSCDKLLEFVFMKNQESCKVTAGLDVDTARKTMAGGKAKMKFGEIPITKQMLEHAFQNGNKKGKAAKSQPTNAIAGTPASASSSAAPSAALPAPVAAVSSNHTVTVDEATSAVSTLTIDNPATLAPTQLASTVSNVPANSTTTTGAAPSSNAAVSTTAQSVPPIGTPVIPNDESLQAVPEVGVRRPPQAGIQSKDTVVTNYFKVTLGKKKDGGAHILHEYQITGLLVNPPNDLSRPKKKVMIKRFIQLSGFLNADNAPFVVNGEGRVIAWQNLEVNTQVNNTVDQQNVPDFDRNQNGVVTQHVNMSLVYVRPINLSDLVSYSSGNQVAHPASIAEEALNILVGRAVEDSNTGAIQIGDNHFYMPNPEADLGGWGMAALRGFTSHVKARQGGLFLNVNTALSAFHRAGNVNHHISSFLSAPNKYPHDFLQNVRATQHLTGVRVRIRYSRDKPGEVGSKKDTPEGRLKTITGFSKTPADQTFFVDRSGATVSVWQHFQTDHPAEAAQSVRKGKQICVNTSSAQPGRQCWFLSDQLDVVPGQIYRKTLDRLNPKMTARLITMSVQRPLNNQQAIQNNGMPALGFRPQLPDPVRLLQAGIAVDRQMIQVPFRQIPPPVSRYSGTSTVKYSSAGQWSTRGMKFLSQDRQHFNGTTGIAFFCPSNGLTQQKYGAAYIEGFKRSWQLNYHQSQHQIATAGGWQHFPATGMANLQTVIVTMRACKAGVVILALPAANSNVRPSYANFRIAMDQVIGKPSLVICEERVLGSIGQRAPNAAAFIPYFANNAAKLNGRLGNMNHTTDGYGELSPGNICNTLVIGGDLIHPKATSAEVCPTIACIAASIDGVFAKFLGSARRQDARVEIIDNNNMISMVTEAVENWRSNNAGRLPDRILYYRDGTGDSQYAGILREVSAIKTAWQNVAGPQRFKEVAVTAVVAVKRHTTRFYPRKGGPSTRTGNIIPGSVINTGITSPYYFDFYLQSHDVEQGSAKPTLYRVLENGMNFSEVALQDLTNAFCYNFSHSTSAVSYASPAYYADRLCERSMLYLREFFDNDQSVQSLANDTARNTQLDVAWGRGGQGVGRNPWHKNFNDKMFWM